MVKGIHGILTPIATFSNPYGTGAAWYITHQAFVSGEETRYLSIEAAKGAVKLHFPVELDGYIPDQKNGEQIPFSVQSNETAYHNLPHPSIQIFA